MSLGFLKVTPTTYYNVKGKGQVRSYVCSIQLIQEPKYYSYIIHIYIIYMYYIYIIIYIYISYAVTVIIIIHMHKSAS